MTLFAVEGAAGCGKTVRLMETLGEALAEAPLHEGQRVLALTFMHGARRRLNENLCGVGGLRGRFECATIDSFAWRLLRRWRSLAAALGIELAQERQYDAQCDAAGALLERPEVRSWVAASFPIVMVDEAQDLKPQRLRMVRVLAQSATMLLAADEFQCLDPTLRPNPFVEWMRGACQPEELNLVRRTDVPALLAAATAIRAGGVPAVGKSFRISAAQGVPVAAAMLASAIRWRNGGRVAVITPSMRGGFACSVVRRVCEHPCGAQRNGPYAIHWERSDQDEVRTLLEGLELNEISSTEKTLMALELLPRSGPIRDAGIWVRHQARTLGRRTFSRAEIEEVVARQVAIRRQQYGADKYDFTAMTVQQAKNREFEGVFILWPYQVGGDAEHKRRLLYNALTRAKRWCTIVVQNPRILNEVPFGVGR